MGEAATLASGRHGWIIPGIVAGTAAWVCIAAWTLESTNIAGAATVSAQGETSGLDPSALVDGDETRDVVVRSAGGRPHATLDLGRRRDIDAIVVRRSRTEGPLVIEISLDGELYGAYGSNDEPFEEWRVEQPARARYVRVRRPKRGAMAIAEIEVIGP